MGRSTTWVLNTDKLLVEEKLGAVVVRLMMVMNDISITNSQMFEWEETEDLQKKFRRRGAILYFGRVQSAHLFEALNIIREIKSDDGLVKRVERCQSHTVDAFHVVARFLDTDDYTMMAKMRNVVAFHYDGKLSLRRMKRMVELVPAHCTAYSLGTETLDWYFELGDAVTDEILIREVFQISEDKDLAVAALEVLKRLHVIGEAFSNFAGHFIRHCCAKA